MVLRSGIAVVRKVSRWSSRQLKVANFSYLHVTLLLILPFGLDFLFSAASENHES